jgi:glycosyltransferase involved in cell wall biosynthesis
VKDKLVSVIIPCYNQGKYIDETIQSVLASTYSNIEIIVVNDGSIDKLTIEILKSKSWKKTTIYHTENKGVCHARNYAIKQSKGEFILPLDADDKISRDYIFEAVQILSDNPKVKVVCCDVEMFGVKKGLYPLPEYSMEMLLAQNTMVVTSMFRRFDFEKTNGYNENMNFGFEDWDFWLNLLKSGGEVHKIEKTHFFYRINRGTRNSSISLEKFSKLRRQIYENHKDLYSKYFLDPKLCFEYQIISQSKEYKVGKWIIGPIRKLLKIINNITSFNIY